MSQNKTSLGEFEVIIKVKNRRITASFKVNDKIFGFSKSLR
ncbi:MAG: hypothetical protein QXT38_01905 [Candidatus Aenigmatarchaeota archaeon]